MRRTPAAAALLLMLSVSACAEPDAKEATGNTDAAKATEDAPSNAEIEKYFEALARTIPTTMEAVRSEIVEPGSLADAYTSHFIYSSNANLDAGFPPAPQKLNDIDGGYELCDTEMRRKGACTKFPQIESANGKLADFTVGGKDLRDRISVGDGTKKTAGPLGINRVPGRVSAVSIGNFPCTPGSRRKTNLTGPIRARYRSPDGRQSTATSASTTGRDRGGLDGVRLVLLRASQAGRSSDSADVGPRLHDRTHRQVQDPITRNHTSPRWEAGGWRGFSRASVCSTNWRAAAPTFSLLRAARFPAATCHGRG